MGRERAHLIFKIIVNFLRLFSTLMCFRNQIIKIGVLDVSLFFIILACVFTLAVSLNMHRFSLSQQYLFSYCLALVISVVNVSGISLLSVA